ncbi:MAG: hypothetical protein E7672_04450 [Ruminococcaceae bacterium]|nr:hypothetical protein [Oscillospiraceae bacterium]
MCEYICVVSSDLPHPTLQKLSDSFKIVVLPRDNTIAAPVSSHPDMILSVVDHKLIFPRSYCGSYPAAIQLISSLSGYELVLSDAPRSAEYPLDTSLNAAVGDRYVICRKKSCAPELLSHAAKNGYDIIDVKQGYSGCSCIVTPRGVITSDIGIHTALNGQGIESILVSNHGISLPGYDVGFIGGCGGFCDGTLYFLGNISSLPCSDPISHFARERGYNIVCLSDDPLTDYGGIKFIKIK